LGVTERDKRLVDNSVLVPLIGSIARGDERAFERLYELVSSQLFGLILRMVRDRSEAEDILQDVFVRIWSKASTYDSKAGEPMAWICSIARYRAIDHLRTAPKLRKVDNSEELLAGLAAPEVEGGLLAGSDALQACLDTLEQESRECVVQAYACGYSGKELALRFGRPENTIKSWLRRGLAALKTCLDQKA